jgi:Beta-lactamase
MRFPVALLCVLGLAAVAAADPVDDYVRGQLASRHLPGVSVAVIKDGVLVKAAGYGVSLELPGPHPHRRSARFRYWKHLIFLSSRIIFEKLGLASAPFQSNTDVVPNRGVLIEDE